MPELDVGTVCESLGGWFLRQHRDLPWRRTRDPYRILVSEIMLAQTRVDTVIAYYERFLAHFPDVHTLARASSDQVMKQWEGLGYYARARNLHRAAQDIARGGMPSSADRLRALPGVGRYTAGAVASLAFGERVAAVDGNVERVVSRLWASDLGAAPGRAMRAVWARAEQLVAACADVYVHNQAMMELGATVCTPRAPRCEDCPLRAQCRAWAEGDVERYPPRAPSRALPTHDVCAGYVVDGARFLVVRRPAEGLLGGLWDLPAARRATGERLSATCRRGVLEQAAQAVRVGRALGTVTHVFTHFRMQLHAFACTPQGCVEEVDGRRWIGADDVAALAFPNATRRLLEMIEHG